MAGASNVLREYLVRLGFKVETTSQHQFESAIGKSTAQVIEMGAAVEATAALVVTGFAKMAEGMEKLFFVARNADATVTGIKTLGYALTQLGGSAEATTTAIESFGKFLQGSPGAIGLVRSLGIQTNDANGNLRDTAAIMGDLGKRLREMPTYRAQAYAGVFGIDYHTLMAMRQGTEEFSNQYQGWLRTAGVDTDKAAAASHGFMVQLRGLLAVFGILEQKIILALGPGMGRTVENFRNLVMKNMDPITHVIGILAKGIVGAGEVIILFIERATQAFNALGPAGRLAVEALFAILYAWRALSIGFMATPVGLAITAVVAALAGLLLLFDDFRTYQEGGKTLIDWGKLLPQIQPLIDGFKAVRDYIIGIWPEVEATALSVFKTIRDTAVEVWPDITAAAKGFWDMLVQMADAAKPIWNTLVTGLKDVWSALNDLGGALSGIRFNFFEFGNWIKNELVSAFKIVAEVLNDTLGTGLHSIADLIRLISAMLKGDWTEAWNQARDIAQTVFDFFDRQVTRLRNLAPALGRKLFGDPIADQATESAGLAAEGGGFGAGSGKRTVGDPGPTANFDDVVQFFMKKGLSMAQAVGIASNLDVESAGMHPQIWGDNGQAFGLAQWHPDRRRRIEAHFGKPMESMSASEQLEAVWWEGFQGPEAAAGQALLNGPNEAGAAAAIWSRTFERPGDAAGQAAFRMAHARRRLSDVHAIHKGDWFKRRDPTSPVDVVNPDAGPRLSRLAPINDNVMNSLTVPAPVIGVGDGSVPVSINQTNNFNVSGVSNPNSAADEVLRGQKRVTADLARNTAGAVR